MPKDELDPEDPMELCGVGLLTAEDTTEAMAECFIEEFMRLDYDPAQILALFRNPHYTGVHMALEKRGEDFVRAKITEVFGWWQRPVAWPESDRTSEPPPVPQTGLVSPGPTTCQG